MPCLDLMADLHTRTPRDYLARVNGYPKHLAATVAKRFDREYWDGERHFGYGGMRYDGRWSALAQRLVARYRLDRGARVLDVGCGKGFLLHDLQQAAPGLEVRGLDLSRYAIEHAHPPVHGRLVQGRAQALPYADRSFDLVVSVTTLHNLYCYELEQALREIVRVAKTGEDGRTRAYIVVESYRNEQEKANLLYWQLTCECFFTPAEWRWWFRHSGYSGDYSFIYFE